MTIYGLNMDGLGTDTPEIKRRRAALGALYGLLGGAAFALVAAFVDIWLHPDLPLGVNWDTLLMRLPLIALGLALAGAITCWWHEAWLGLFSGSAVTAAFALTVALFSSPAGAGLKVIVLMFIFLPIAAMSMPIAYLLRWITERHTRLLDTRWGTARIAGLILSVILIGGGLGYFMKSPARGIESTRYIHNLLQDTAAGTILPTAIPGIADRAAVPYALYPIKSDSSTEGFDVHIRYRDGHQIVCTVILYPGRAPYLSGCQAQDP
ncbi:MAG: hypothetical protein HXY42_08540 [Chloroflexi bacterium]|nr:hypothetical protein [Chloroflexota bacterium]